MFRHGTELIDNSNGSFALIHHRHCNGRVGSRCRRERHHNYCLAQTIQGVGRQHQIRLHLAKRRFLHQLQVYAPDFLRFGVMALGTPQSCRQTLAKPQSRLPSTRSALLLDRLAQRFTLRELLFKEPGNGRRALPVRHKREKARCKLIEQGDRHTHGNSLLYALGRACRRIPLGASGPPFLPVASVPFLSAGFVPSASADLLLG
jgi:hypothetical protein